jgi:hypothetical protein
LLNKPIVNYRVMKRIFDQPPLVNWKKVYSPSNLIAAIDHLADNKVDGNYLRSHGTGRQEDLA